VFSCENCKFSHPLIFCAPVEWVSLEFDIGAVGQKTRMMELPGRARSFTISLAVWIQYINMIDGRTDTGRQQRPRLRIASRGKNGKSWASQRGCLLRQWPSKNLLIPTCTLNLVVLLQTVWTCKSGRKQTHRQKDIAFYTVGDSHTEEYRLPNYR